MNPRYPIMAAMLAASLGTVSLGTSHAEPPRTTPAEAPPSCPPKVEGATDLTNLLAAFIHCEDRTKAHIGEKLAAFVLEKDAKGPLFVTKQISESEGHKADVAKAAKEWPKKAPATDVANLYWVLGDAAAPEWLEALPAFKGRIKAPTSAEDDKRRLLRPALTPKWRANDEGKIAWQKFNDDVNLFLLDAAAAAKTILAQNRTSAQLRTDIVARQDDQSVPGGIGSGRRGAAFVPFDEAYHYANGGFAGVVSGPNDKVSVPYNLKLETVKEPNGDLKTYVAIYDTGANPIVMQRVPITARGENALRIGSGKEVWSLVLDVKATEGGDLSLVLRRPDDKDGTYAMRTSANALGEARLKQAVDAAQVVEVGGESYYLSSQGGTVGTYLYYPTSLAGRRAGWADLTPKHAAVIAKIGPDGRFVPADGEPNIGKINGQSYKLKYNAQSGRWEPLQGDGTMPAPLVAAAAVAPAPGAPGAPAGPADLANAGSYTANVTAEAGLSAEAKSKGYKIHSKGSGDQTEYLVLTPAGFINGNQRLFLGARNLRGVGHYVAYTRADNGAVLYHDLYAKETVGGQEDLKRVAVVAGGKLSSVTPLKDFDVLEDGLKSYVGFSAADTEKAVANAKSKAGASEYAISAAQTGKVIIVVLPNKSWQVFPDVIEGAAADNPQVAGTGTAMEPVTQGVASSDGEGVPLGPTYNLGAQPPYITLARIQMDTNDAATGTAALYRKGAPEAADAEWYLFFKFRENGASKLRRSNEMRVFSRVSDHKRLDFPTVPVSLKGQTAYGGNINPATATLSLVVGSTREKGAWVLLKAPSQQVNPDNCVGPVLWWGLTPEAAFDAGCKKGRLE